MDERANRRVPNPAGALQGWAQQRAQPQQPTFVPPPSVAATAPVSSPAYPAPGSVPNPMAGRPDDDGERKRRWPRVVLICAGALTLVALGSCAGGLGQSEEVASLESEPATTSTQLAGAESERDELQLLVVEQGDAVEAAEAATEELETTETDVATAQTDLATAQTTISERDATIASLQAELAAAQAAAAPAQVIAPVAATPTQPQAAAPAAPSTSAYYQNCTAVRQAGAAPIYAGQPGSGPHLDRDGDGVACES